MKGKKRSRQSASNTVVWSGADHADRQDKKISKLQKHASGESKREHRRAVLTHETAEKRDHTKLRLHLIKTQRELAKLKARLESWDPHEEKERRRIERAAAELNVEQDNDPPKKKGRKGPEAWTLRGAARSAWEVYDFDTRYKDPHLEAHAQAKERAQRSQNILALCKGTFAQDAPPEGRDYLSLLMQLGHLSQEAKQFKAARAAWLECMDLEGNKPITTARESLMRMYLDLKRDEAAVRLGDRLVDDTSVWVRYSTALLAVKTKSADKMETHLVAAIKSNIFCAYYLAFYDTFRTVFEYTEDFQDAEDEPQSSLEEAIEYCTSNQTDSWIDSQANVSLRNLLLAASKGQHPALLPSDLHWSARLDKIEEVFEARRQHAYEDGQDAEPSQGPEKTIDDAQESDEEDADTPIDLGMFIGMFRTAMEMVEESDMV
jgi:hypothetical protein